VDPDNIPPEFLERFYDELSPDGPEHYPVVVAKLAKMHVEGPTLTVAAHQPLQLFGTLLELPLATNRVRLGGHSLDLCLQLANPDNDLRLRN
jgi:hypothetical protein